MRGGATIFNCALADSSRSFSIGVGERIGHSSIMAPSGPSYSVEASRLDELVASFTRPALCKIDVQGAAMLVLRGAEKIIYDIDVFIIETNVFAPAGDDVADIMEHLGRRDFCLYDIAGVIRRPIDNAVGQIDMVFVKKDSGFRKDRRWVNQ
jgi:methyltransferase FkbM-like protein